MHLPIRVRDVMTCNPVAVERSATVKDMAQLLVRHDIHALPVVDPDGALAGIVSEADLVSWEGYPTTRAHRLAGILGESLAEHLHHDRAQPEVLTAGTLMTSGVETCRPDDLVAAASRRMIQHGVRVLPVVEDGRLIGVLSRQDVLRLLDRPDEEIRQRVEALLADPRWTPEDVALEVAVHEGVVTLTGTVATPRDAELVLDVARLIPGVVGVVDHLRAERPDAKVHFAKDTDLRA
ncbi:MAG: CBS domain-containing protein [Acidimicrobiaceae bacterium]|nr:CBS domain-containing protein [Acidimicrobiaceae bacterium]